MTRIGEQAGAAITNMQPGKRGTRAYFDVEDINAGAARVKELGGEADDPAAVPGMGWFAACKDPHGNEFGLWQNDRRPRPRPARPHSAFMRAAPPTAAPPAIVRVFERSTPTCRGRSRRS